MDLTLEQEKNGRAVAAAGGADASPVDAPLAVLPEEPVVRIRPRQAWVALDLRDLWIYRELLYFLTWRDVKVRYKQTALGAAWAVIQPLMAMLIFTLVFGKFAGVPSEGMPYPIFAYAGLLPWTFFQNAVSTSTNSLVGSANLITKVYFPRMIIPAAAVCAGLVDFAISFAILLVMMVIYQVPFTAGLVMLVPLTLLTTLLATAVGMWLSALNVKYRDIRYAVPFMVQVWMYASPIIYPPTMVPEQWRWVLLLNPLTGIIEGYRATIFAQKDFDWIALSASVVVTVVLMVYAAFYFRRVEKGFADIV